MAPPIRKMPHEVPTRSGVSRQHHALMLERLDQPTAFIKNHHIHVDSRCAICTRDIHEREKCVALLGDHLGDDAMYRTKPFLYYFQHNMLSSQKSEIPLCSIEPDRCSNAPYVQACVQSPEAVTMHWDCYRLFMKESNQERELDRIHDLWVSTAWRRPWQRSTVNPTPPLDLDEYNITFLQSSTARALGMPGLASLPLEILQMIRSYVPESILWRISIVRGLSSWMANTIGAWPGNRWTSTSLRDIREWNRGQQVLTSDGNKTRDQRTSVFRITIDTYGLRKIEILPRWPRFHSGTTNGCAYAFIPWEDAECITVKFKPGCARIKLPEKHPAMILWDTPGPPRIGKRSEETSSPIPPEDELHVFVNLNPEKSVRLRTVSLQRSTGITFFYKFNSIWAIYSHTPEAPTATSTLQRFPQSTRDELIPVHVPISPKDRILKFGVKEYGTWGETNPLSDLSILIRTELAGDVVWGPFPYHRDPSDELFDGAPCAIVYSVPNTESAMFGVVVNEDLSAKKEVEIPLPPLNIDTIHRFYRNTIYAQAPLSGISRIGVFYDKESGSEKHKGILLTYKNGGQRALGICRVGLDPIKFYERPSGLRYRYRVQARLWKESHLKPPDLYEIECYNGTHDETNSTGIEWTYSPLEGHIIQCQWDFEVFEMKITQPKAQ